jgi:hypothetical protein
MEAALRADNGYLRMLTFANDLGNFSEVKNGQTTMVR